jgi:hypothetical protein
MRKHKIWRVLAAVLHFAPGLEPLNHLITAGRFAITSLLVRPYS